MSANVIKPHLTLLLLPPARSPSRAPLRSTPQALERPAELASKAYTVTHLPRLQGSGGFHGEARDVSYSAETEVTVISFICRHVPKASSLEGKSKAKKATR